MKGAQDTWDVILLFFVGLLLFAAAGWIYCIGREMHWHVWVLIIVGGMVWLGAKRMLDGINARPIENAAIARKQEEQDDADD